MSEKTDPTNSYLNNSWKEGSMLLHCDMYKGKCDEINSYLM